eukprot:93204_1
MASDSFSFYVSITYFSIYGVVFLITSIYCFREVYNESRNRLLSDDSNIISVNIKTELELPYKRTPIKFFKAWLQSIWKKKSIYISIIPHLFDQATDVGVIYTYYELSKKHGSENEWNVNFNALFISSLLVILMHKIISCGMIYSLTESFGDLLLQFLDLMMVKAVHTNYKLKLDEPGNAQRLLQLIEATFESAPQIFISFLFIIKTNQTEPLVLISVTSSLWTLATRITSDDKGVIYDEWKHFIRRATREEYKINGGYIYFYYPSYRTINWRYILRVFGRLIEVSSRIIVLALLWVSVGGLTLCIILGVELSFALILCFWSGDIMILANMLYYTVPDSDSVVPEILFHLFLCFRVGLQMVYLLLITIFATFTFNAWKVQDYEVRNRNIIKQKFGLSLLLYCWISSCLTICFLQYMNAAAFDGHSSGRGIKTLAKNGKFKEIMNLVQFGLSKKRLMKTDGSGTVLHYLFKECQDENLLREFCQMILKIDDQRQLWSETDESGKFCINNDSIGLNVVKFVVNECKIDLVNKMTNEDGTSAMQYMIIDSDDSRIDLIKYLVEECDINLMDLELNFKESRSISALQYIMMNRRRVNILSYLASKYENNSVTDSVNMWLVSNAPPQNITILQNAVKFGMNGHNFMKYNEEINGKEIQTLLSGEIFPVDAKSILEDMMIDIRLNPFDANDHDDDADDDDDDDDDDDHPFDANDSFHKQIGILKSAVLLNMSVNNFMKHANHNITVINALLRSQKEYDINNPNETQSLFPQQAEVIVYDMVRADKSLVHVKDKQKRTLFHGLVVYNKIKMFESIIDIIKENDDNKENAYDDIRLNDDNYSGLLFLVLDSNDVLKYIASNNYLDVASIDILLSADLNKNRLMLINAANFKLSVNNFMLHIEYNVPFMMKIMHSLLFPIEAKEILCGMNIDVNLQEKMQIPIPSPVLDKNGIATIQNIKKKALVNVMKPDSKIVMNAQEQSQVLKNAGICGMNVSQFMRYMKLNITVIGSLLASKQFPHEAKDIFLNMIRSLTDTELSEVLTGTLFHALAVYDDVELFKSIINISYSDSETIKINKDKDCTLKFVQMKNSNVLKYAASQKYIDMSSIDLCFENSVNITNNITILKNAIDFGVSANNFMKYGKGNMKVINNMLSGSQFPQDGKQILCDMISNDSSLSHVKNQNGRTVFHALAMCNDLELCKWMIDSVYSGEKNINLNDTDDSYDSALKFLMSDCLDEEKYEEKKEEKQPNNVLKYLVTNKYIDINLKHVCLKNDFKVSENKIILKNAVYLKMTAEHFMQYKEVNIKSMNKVLYEKEFPAEAIYILRGLIIKDKNMLHQVDDSGNKLLYGLAVYSDIQLLKWVIEDISGYSNKDVTEFLDSVQIEDDGIISFVINMSDEVRKYLVLIQNSKS